MCFPQTSDPSQPTISLLLPHLSPLREMSLIISLDAKRGAELHDGARVQADLIAMHGLAQQLRTADGITITQLVGLRIDNDLVDRLQHVLSEQPDVLTDPQLIQFAHLLAGPRVAADLLNVNDERYFFDDIIQRVYTDNGNGDGHLTLKGAENSQQWINSSDLNLWAAASTVPLATASRAELVAKFNTLLDQAMANLHHPMREVAENGTDAKLVAMHNSSTDSVRFAILNALFFSIDHLQTNCESYLGTRDGTLVAISLELFHRRHGSYPATLNELTLDLLPEIPADRITGDPVKYRLIDGKPIVYSVGVDRTDDGGRRSPRKLQFTPEPMAAWDKPQEVQHGDWVLYPPDPADADDQ
jgi:hypothetical protein